MIIACSFLSNVVVKRLQALLPEDPILVDPVGGLVERRRG